MTKHVCVVGYAASASRALSVPSSFQFVDQKVNCLLAAEHAKTAVLYTQVPRAALSLIQDTDCAGYLCAQGSPYTACHRDAAAWADSKLAQKTSCVLHSAHVLVSPAAHDMRLFGCVQLFLDCSRK